MKWAAFATAIVLLGLVLLGTVTRLYTTNSLAGEPTSDEYLYGLLAREVGRAWASGAPFPAGDVADEGRVLAFETAAATFVLPWDTITAGRAVQALLNALLIPATYLLGRRLGLGAAASGAGAVLLAAVPELQEGAWRLWPDSQAALLTVAFLWGLAGWIAERSRLHAALGIAVLAAQFGTKDSAAFTLLPLLLLAPLARRPGTGRPPARLLAVVGAVLVLLAGAAVLSSGTLARLPILGRPLQTLGLLPEALGSAVVLLPSYAARLGDLFGAAALGLLLPIAWVSGSAWIAARAFRARRWGWGAAASLTVLTLVVPLQALATSGRTDALLAAAAGAASAAGAGWRIRGDREAASRGWLLALASAVVVAFLVQRLVVTALPRLGGGAAFTTRAFFPILPLAALLGGVGLERVAAWLGERAGGSAFSRVRWHRSFALAVVLVLGTIVWTPLLARTTDQSLFGRVADRGADLATPQGLRVEALVQAEDWLKLNLRPNDVVLTGIPRLLAWYADVGAEGLAHMVDLGSQPRTMAQRRAFIRERIGPDGADYVADFNLAWTTPDSEEAREWRQTYQWLASQPWLEVVYLRRDANGQPVFYVVRNHGYALSGSYRDREEARAEERELQRGLMPGGSGR